jgi:hypothetical protein
VLGSAWVSVVVLRLEAARAANGHGSRHVDDQRLAATGPRRVSSICDARDPRRVRAPVCSCVSGSGGNRGEGDTDSAGQSNADVLLRFRSSTQAPYNQNPSCPRPIGPPSLCRAWRAIGPFAAADLGRGSFTYLVLQLTRPPLAKIPQAHGRQQGRKAPPAWVFFVAAAASCTIVVLTPRHCRRCVSRRAAVLLSCCIGHAGRRRRQNVTTDMLLDAPARAHSSQPPTQYASNHPGY